MSQKVGEFIIERIGKWGVKRVFGYPGDGINGAALGEKELTYVSPINEMIKNEFNAPVTVSFLRNERKWMSVPTLVAPIKSTTELSAPALIEYLKFPGNEELNHKESPMRMLSLPGLKAIYHR